MQVQDFVRPRPQVVERPIVTPIYEERPYIQRLKRHDDAVLMLYSPEGNDGSHLFSASADEVVRIWDMRDRSISKPMSFTRPNDNKLMPYRMTDD